MVSSGLATLIYSRVDFQVSLISFLLKWSSQIWAEYEKKKIEKLFLLGNYVSQDKLTYAAVSNKVTLKFQCTQKRFIVLLYSVFIPGWSAAQLHTVLRDPGGQRLHHVTAAPSGTRGPLNHWNMGGESKEWHKGIFCPSLPVTYTISAYISLLRTCQMAHLTCRIKYNV